MTDVVIIEAGGPFVIHPLSFAVCSKMGRGKAVYINPWSRGFSSLLIPAIRCVLFLAQCGGLCQYTHQTNFKEILQLQIIDELRWGKMPYVFILLE